jgi:hypothetical protein
MFQSFRRSWELVKASFAVLRADKELIWFPVFSGIALVMVSIAFLVPMALLDVFSSIFGSGQGGEVAGFVILFIYYVVAYFVMIFSNTAVVGAALKRLRGGDPSFQDGLNTATGNTGKIFGYSVIAATVGMILQALRSDDNIAANVVSWIGGLAWNLATFLVVPVMVAEGVGPIAALRRSAGLLRQTWGQQIIGNAGISLVFFFLFLAVVIPGGLLVMVAFSVTPVLGILFGVLVVLAVLGLMAVQTTLSGIYTAAVYNFAVAPAEVTSSNQFFDQSLLQSAFRHK